MHSFATLILFLAAIQIGYAGNTEYILPGSVQCTSTGVYFAFSEDPTKSDLYKDTKLKIDLYTSSKNKKVADADFDITSGKVSLAFKDYQFDATVSYGPDHRPLLDNIEQPFYAVPKAGTASKHNYTFGVYCTVPASYPVNIINKTDNTFTNEVAIINPKDHISVDINGLKSGNIAKLGDHLSYTVSLTDDTYAALLPVNCKFFNPNQEGQNLPFVSDSCPRVFPTDPDAYFQTMVKKNATSYEINFRAFTFASAATSALGISCDLQLCITQNIDYCYKPCWDGPAPTPSPSKEPPTIVRISDFLTVQL